MTPSALIQTVAASLTNVHLLGIAYPYLRPLLRIVSRMGKWLSNNAEKFQDPRGNEVASATRCTERNVTPDPCYASRNGPCEACGQSSKKRPTIVVMWSAAQLQRRSSVDTSPILNPFLGKEPVPFLLCTSYRSPKDGWAVICDRKRYCKKSIAALKAWKSRVAPRSRDTGECYICARIKALVRPDLLPEDIQLERRALLNLQLFKVLLYSSQVREIFCKDLSRRSGLSVADARFMLLNIENSRFCSLHHNHTRHSCDTAAKHDPASRGLKRGNCIFRGNGCSDSNVMLKPLPRMHRKTLDDTEAYFGFDNAVFSHSGGKLGIEEVAGKQACGVCRYILSKGEQGVQPSVDSVLLDDPVDRCLVDCVLFALDMGMIDSVFIRGNELVLTQARKLKSKVITPFTDAPKSCFLRISDVFATRKSLLEVGGESSRSVCDKTIQSRLGPVLAAKNVHLFSLTRKFRCYAVGSSLSETVQNVISLSKDEEVDLPARQRRQMLLVVSKRFQDKRDNYRRGSWSLAEEICAIPPRLWSSFALDMASNQQLTSWKVAASSEGTSITEMFPISNSMLVLPKDDLDNFAHASLRNSERRDTISRADFLLCLRVLKVIEQVVFSRSRMSVGPLKMTLSIACIIESTASWSSVLHSLGVVTSYDTMDKFRKRLISEREQAEHGAFDETTVNDRVVTVQLDNFDILPHHSVKASGKALPMVSGTVTQGVIQSRKRRRISSSDNLRGHVTATSQNVETNDSGWRDAKETLSSREHFVSMLNSRDDQKVLDDFSDVVFGIVHSYRDELLGVSSTKSTYKRGEKEHDYKHQGVNFRTLLLSCFKQHGGLKDTDPSLFDQEVVFVDVSRQSAADILTIHQKLALIKDLVKPGEPGKPRYIIVSGDQPTYLMLVKIWRQSYRESMSGNERGTIPGELRVHDWLVPFPGFFHVEKQSLFPLCKEMLHGLGLKEMAACCGLSPSQLENILKHAHARNNRTLIFNICVALIIHTMDLTETECPDLKDSIENILNTANSEGCSKPDSALIRCTNSRVTNRTVEVGRLIRKRVSQFFSNIALTGSTLWELSCSPVYYPQLGFTSYPELDTQMYWTASGFV